MFKSKKDKKKMQMEDCISEKIIRKIRSIEKHHSRLCQNKVICFPQIKEKDETKITQICEGVLKSFSTRLLFSLVLAEDVENVEESLDYFPIFYLNNIDLKYTNLDMWNRRVIPQTQLQEIILFDEDEQRTFLKNKMISEGIDRLIEEIKSISSDTILMWGMSNSFEHYFPLDEKSKEMLESVAQNVTEKVYETHKIKVKGHVSRSLITKNSKYIFLCYSLNYQYEKSANKN
jgi:hypothetical protein